MSNKEKQQKEKVEAYLAFLKKVKTVFEPRYGKPLDDDFVEEIARNLITYACVCHNASSRIAGKKPMYEI